MSDDQKPAGPASVNDPIAALVSRLQANLHTRPGAWGVAACLPVSPDVRSHANPQNKANSLSHAAAEVAAALVAPATTPHASVAPATALAPVGSPGVSACPPVSPDVRSRGSAQNKANSPPGPALAARAGANGGLSEQQLAAVRFLLDRHRPTAIAAHLKIASRTLLRWRRSPAFVAEVRRQNERRCLAR